MIRYYTANRDALIYKELRRGYEPKQVAMRLALKTKDGKPNTDIVYKAMARDRRGMLLPVEYLEGPERRTRHLNLPKFANKLSRRARVKESIL